MKNETAKSSSNRIGNKIRFSIVWKLNTKLFIRMLRLFLVLDLLLCLLAAGGLFLRIEQTAAKTIARVIETGLPSPDAENWLALTGYRISPGTGGVDGYQLPKGLQPYLPEQTAAAVRYIDPSPSAEKGIRGRFPELTYSLMVKTDKGFYRISYHLKTVLQIYLAMFAIVLIFELLSLMRSIAKGARIIRRTLQPIQDLAETARNLSNESLFAPEQLRDMAGKLDNINAAQLDTRIALGATQSELKGLASAINGMLDRINEAYRSQVRFVSDASHELRTPISVIQGYANLLDRWGKKDEKTLQESIDAIKDETANMKALVEQLLFLARGDNNTITLQVECFDLSKLAEEVLRETQMIDAAHEYGSSLQSVFITADKGLVKQTLRIFIDNALKYTPTGKRITLSVSRDTGNARMTVQDEGIGIAPEAVPKIFDRFFRTDESRTRATGGAGLGLSIAKWITERHGGHLEVLSRQNIGTRVSILLPISPEALSHSNID